MADGLSPSVSQSSKDKPIPGGGPAGIPLMPLQADKILSSRPLTSFLRNRKKMVSLYDACQLESHESQRRDILYLQFIFLSDRGGESRAK